MASVLLTKTGGRGGVGGGPACDQTELLSGVKCSRNGDAGGACGDADEAASSFLTLEEGSEAEAGGARRGGKGAGGAACACRLAGERVTWLLLGLLLLAAVAATAVALDLYRGREIDALRRDVEELKQYRGREALEAVRRDMEALKQGAGEDLQREMRELKHKVVELDLYTKLRQFEDEVYEMEEDGTDDDEGDDEDEEDEEDDLPANSEDDVDYYSASEELDESAERGATPGPEHRGRFHPQSEPAGAALAAAAAEAAAEAAESLAPRPKREIASAASSVSGVPVLSESYGSIARRANGTEGLSLYKTMGGGHAPPAAGHVPPRHTLLRSGPWASKRAGKENRDTEAAATRRELDSHAPVGVFASQQGSAASATPGSNVISRQSYVMKTATPAPPNPRRYTAPRIGTSHASRLQWAHGGRTTEVTPPPQGTVKVYQDQRGGATLRSGGGSPRPKKVAVKKALRDGEEGTTGTRTQHPLRRRPVFAAHYGGDASSYTLDHEHYGGNGRLRHPNKVFTDWLSSEWVNQLSMDRKFSLNNGEVTVTDSGLYFIYAQIFYLDEKDTNGYRVEVNNKPVLHCIVTSGQTAGGIHALKANTCFTAGAMYLAPGDRVSVREVGDLRWTVFEPEKSFFGLVKLGHTARIT